MQLILASTSQARQAVLRAAGITPAQLWPPATDEAAVVEAANLASIDCGIALDCAWLSAIRY